MRRYHFRQPNPDDPGFDMELDIRGNGFVEDAKVQFRRVFPSARTYTICSPSYPHLVLPY